MATLNLQDAALLYGLLLARQQAMAEGGGGSEDSASDEPIPITMPHPEHHTGENYQSEATTTSPTNSVPLMPQPPTMSSPVPSRPVTPTNLDVATTSLAWRLHTMPLFARLLEALYENDNNSLPSVTLGRVGYLKLDGYGSRDTTENMHCLIDFLSIHKWEEQLVDAFIERQRDKPHWPAKLTDAPLELHRKYAWHLMEGMLGIYTFKQYLPSTPISTFQGVVSHVFPELPETRPSGFLRVPRRVGKPQRFSFSVRDLLDEGFIIEPSNDLIDHFHLVGDVVKVYMLDTSAVKTLMSYHQNRVAKAVGLTNLGNEILQSYAALTQIEFQENFKLPIQLGMFKIDPASEQKGGYSDLTVVTGVIQLFHNNPEFDPQPHLLASRVWAIEEALRTRRHWYKRLRRDIHKRKKEEPWMFWGATLAVFFGVCTVIQTVTSVWSLALALS